MKLYKLGAVAAAFAIATSADFLSSTSPAMAFGLAGLTFDNQLLLFDSATPNKTTSVQVTGVSGKLLGIDLRPANNLIYGLTSTNNIYTIDPFSGAAAFVSALSIPFTSGSFSGVDFNPAADRLRVVGANGQNFRINVDTGLVTQDTPLNPGSPAVSGAAYTNVDNDPTTGTTLYNIGAATAQLFIQSPPNDGTLTPVGSLNVSSFGALAGFDIVTANGVDTAFAALTPAESSLTSLYTINLNTGAATSLGVIDDGSTGLIGLTSTAVPEPITMAGLALAGAGLAAARRRVKKA
jgi:Domain of unknown function (DUF4394)